MRKDDKPHTYNTPERFEEHWNEYQKPGMFQSWRALFGFFALILAIWVVIAWVLVVKYW